MAQKQNILIPEIQNYLQQISLEVLYEVNPQEFTWRSIFPKQLVPEYNFVVKLKNKDFYFQEDDKHPYQPTYLYYKNLNIPNIFIQKEMTEFMKQNQNILKQAFKQPKTNIVVEIQALRLEMGSMYTSPLKGVNQKQLLGNSVCFKKLKFTETSYKRSGKPQEGELQNNTGLYDYFLPHLILIEYEKGVKCKETVENITNDVVGLIDYLSSPIIRNKEEHKYIYKKVYPQVSNLEFQRQFDGEKQRYQQKVKYHESESQYCSIIDFTFDPQIQGNDVLIKVPLSKQQKLFYGLSSMKNNNTNNSINNNKQSEQIDGKLLNQNTTLGKINKEQIDQQQQPTLSLEERLNRLYQNQNKPQKPQIMNQNNQSIVPKKVDVINLNNQLQQISNNTKSIHNIQQVSQMDLFSPQKIKMQSANNMSLTSIPNLDQRIYSLQKLEGSCTSLNYMNNNNNQIINQQNYQQIQQQLKGGQEDIKVEDFNFQQQVPFISQQQINKPLVQNNIIFPQIQSGNNNKIDIKLENDNMNDNIIDPEFFDYSSSCSDDSFSHQFKNNPKKSNQQQKQNSKPIKKLKV